MRVSRFAGRATEPPFTNIARRLRDFSPSLAPIEFDRSAFVARAFESAAPFQIPGSLLSSFAVGDDRFEIYYGSLDDNAMRVYVARASVFLPFFIERASYIKPEPNWLALLIFQRRSADVVSFVGLLTLYRWLMPLTARERWRISQVLVLPPFQRRGHGARLLRAVYQLAATWPNGVSGAAAVDDITVEEPSPEFTRMRDAVDLEMLVVANLLPMVETAEMQPTRWRVPGEPRTLVSNDAVLATCRAVRERFRLCDVQTRRLIRAARYLNGDPTRAAEEANGAEADVARPQTLSLRERWCAARHWRVYGEPLVRMQRLQASAAILREHETAASSGVQQVIREWGEEAELFEQLRATFDRAKAMQRKRCTEGVQRCAGKQMSDDNNDEHELEGELADEAAAAEAATYERSSKRRLLR
jgi:GNAT superfamily N-acetyltransferase